MRLTQLWSHVRSRKPSNYYEYFFRICAIPFIWVSLKLKISGNFLTFLALICAIISLPMYLASSIWAIAFANLRIILDHADGSVVRLTGKGSRMGGYIDAMTDKIGFYAVLIGITLNVYFRYHDTIILILGFILFSARDFLFYSTYLIAGIAKQTHPGNRINMKKESIYLFLGSIFIDLVYFLFPFIILFSLPVIMVYYIVFILVELSKLFFELYLTVKENN
jgi:phosphatidylglycerophosphate synthase